MLEGMAGLVVAVGVALVVLVLVLVSVGESAARVRGVTDWAVAEAEQVVVGSLRMYEPEAGLRPARAG